MYPWAGTAQQVFELGVGGLKIVGGEGGGHACGFLFNFSKVTENAIVTIKLLKKKIMQSLLSR